MLFRSLGKPTVNLMTADHLGSAIGTTVNPGMLLFGSQGYTFGLGFLVRQGDGIAPVHGTAGEFMWAGYAGTFFWAEPKEQICGLHDAGTEPAAGVISALDESAGCASHC